MNFATLYCAVLHCTVCAVLYCAALRPLRWCTRLCIACTLPQNDAPLHGALYLVLYCTVLYCTVRTCATRLLYCSSSKLQVGFDTVLG